MITTSGGKVKSIAEQGDIQISGDVTLSEGANITLTQIGQNIEIAAAGGGISEALAIAYSVAL